MGKKSGPSLYEVLRETLAKPSTLPQRAALPATARRAENADDDASPRRSASPPIYFAPEKRQEETSPSPEPEAPVELEPVRVADPEPAPEPDPAVVAVQEPPVEPPPPPEPEPEPAPPAGGNGTAVHAENPPPPPEPPPAPDPDPAPVLEAPPAPEPEPDPEPPAAPEPVPAPSRPEPRETGSLGERRLEVTYNTLLFVGLLLLIAFFAAYVTGFQRGRDDGSPGEMVEAPVDEAPAPEPAAPIPPPPAPVVRPASPTPSPAPAPATGGRFAIQVLRYDRGNGAVAGSFARQLQRDGFADARVVDVGPSSPDPIWVVVGAFATPEDPAAARMMQGLRAHGRRNTSVVQIQR